MWAKGRKGKAQRLRNLQIKPVYNSQQQTLKELNHKEPSRALFKFAALQKLHWPELLCWAHCEPQSRVRRAIKGSRVKWAQQRRRQRRWRQRRRWVRERELCLFIFICCSCWYCYFSYILCQFYLIKVSQNQVWNCLICIVKWKSARCSCRRSVAVLLLWLLYCCGCYCGYVLLLNCQWKYEESIGKQNSE